jgi:delta14-sterol reductase
MGRPLNPRVWGLDLKYFCELRPGLAGWLLLDLSMAAAQYNKLGYVTNSMVLVCCFHAYYVTDATFSERAILTTMDITTDGFGFMLAFGDLAWVPFIYSTQARYLVDVPVDLSTAAVCAIVALNVLGMWIFRASNSQKNQFRSDPAHPSVAHLKTLPTKRGTKLLISG